MYYLSNSLVLHLKICSFVQNNMADTKQFNSNFLTQISSKYINI